METEIKEKFHQLIDSIPLEDLEYMFEVVSEYIDQKGGIDIIDELSVEEKRKLQEGIDDVENDRTYSHEEAMKRLGFE